MRSKQKTVPGGEEDGVPSPRWEVETEGGAELPFVEVRRSREERRARRAERRRKESAGSGREDVVDDETKTEPETVTISAIVPILWLVGPLVLLVLWTFLERWLLP